MAKMYFRYGVVSSAKTLNLLATLHNYEVQGKKAILIKPALDTRSECVESRAGLSHKADIILTENDFIYNYSKLLKDADAILVDEVQFLTPTQIHELRLISIGKDIVNVDSMVNLKRLCSDGVDNVKKIFIEMTYENKNPEAEEPKPDEIEKPKKTTRKRASKKAAEETDE